MSDPGVDPAAVAERVAFIRNEVAVAGGSGRTRLVAVTKGFGVDAWRAAVQAGVIDIGESYAQELETKWRHWADRSPPAPARVHFIGRLQRNKVRRLAPMVSLWHGVDHERLGVEIQRHAPGATVLAQVNISGEPNKGGCPLDRTPALVGQLRAVGLDVVGLMGVASRGDGAHVRSQFRSLAGQASALGLTELSMGMSDDFVVAVEEGATLIRIGRSLFGPRPISQ